MDGSKLKNPGRAARESANELPAPARALTRFTMCSEGSTGRTQMTTSPAHAILHHIWFVRETHFLKDVR
jgi:hypothetical protein